MITIEGQEYLSREDFFAMEQDGFHVVPLDVSLAKAQKELLRLARIELVRGKECIETGFEMHNPQMAVSKIYLKCFLVTGTKDMFDVVMQVEDNEHENFAYGWITMGLYGDIEKELIGDGFVPKCKLWIKWFDYARKNYPKKDGNLYYWTEWQLIESRNHWYDGDVDLYCGSSSQSKMLLSKLITCYEHVLPDGRLFGKDKIISCDYPVAPENETKYDAMELELKCYVSGRIDLIGIIWFDMDFKSIPTRIIIHSFDSVAQCIWWLGRNQNTTRDCHLRMGELLRCGWSYI